MDYKEYLEKYNYCYGHEAIEERMVLSLEELLEELKDIGVKCPDFINGGVPVPIKFDPKSTVESLEEQLWDEEFSGEDYEMSEEGKAFLMNCFEEYNDNYATFGNYCDTVSVKVPDEMRYELSEDEE